MLAAWFVLSLILPSCYVSSDTAVGTVLLESRHHHFTTIIRTVRDVLGLHMSLTKVTIDDAHVLFMKSTAAHSVAQAVGFLKRHGVGLIIGPPDADFGEIVQKICEEQGMAYLSFYYDPAVSSGPKTFRLYPSRQFEELVEYLFKYFHWNRFSIVYSKTKSLRDAHTFIRNGLPDVAFVEIDDTENSSKNRYLDAAKQVRKFHNEDYGNRFTNKVLLELDLNSTFGFLDAALKLGMITADNWFYILGTDNVEYGTEPYSHNMMRLTVTSQFDEHVLRTNSSFHSLISKVEDGKKRFLNNQECLHDLVCFHDAIMSVGLVENHINGGNISKHFHGITGPLRFDNYRMRSDAYFHVLEMGVDGRQIDTGLFRTKAQEKELTFSMRDKQLPNTHESMMEETKTQRLLKVISIEERPYVIRKNLPNGATVLEGFCIDLLDRLSHDLNFEYKLTIMPDGKYGDQVNGTKEWDGLIGELLKGEADAAVAPITVTAHRLEVVDFTDPFLQLGISMLMRIPDEHKTSSSFLSFLWPLSPSIWMYWCLVSVGSVLAVTTSAILSPREPSRKFAIFNSVWYLTCILLRAGSGFNCQSASNRLISTAWWAFTLILIAQYTANFAAVLTVDRKTLPFNSFEELGNQSEYEFGTIHGGSTMQFFMYSRLETFRRIWLRMQNMSKSVFVSNNHEGVQRVLAGKYVFLMESASLEYELTQHCNLTKVGNVVLGSNGYSIALPKGSKWRDRLSRQILDYNEKGIMMMMKRSWWKKTPQIEECEEKAAETKKSLGMDKVSGIFGLLAIGIFTGLIVALFERVVAEADRERMIRRREVFALKQPRNDKRNQ
uniref:Glutamate receptor ionotropic, kainate 2 n=1 Tax=Panagrellus redivivus TaxID=6233 RepID=A0A7E4VW39_PANRE